MCEEDFDKETMSEMNAISNMLSEAEEHGLLAEVIHTYSYLLINENNLTPYANIIENTSNALGEWIK